MLGREAERQETGEWQERNRTSGKTGQKAKVDGQQHRPPPPAGRADVEQQRRHGGERQEADRRHDHGGVPRLAERVVRQSPNGPFGSSASRCAMLAAAIVWPAPDM